MWGCQYPILTPARDWALVLQCGELSISHHQRIYQNIVKGKIGFDREIPSHYQRYGDSLFHLLSGSVRRYRSDNGFVRSRMVRETRGHEDFADLNPDSPDFPHLDWLPGWRALLPPRLIRAEVTPCFKHWANWSLSHYSSLPKQPQIAPSLFLLQTKWASKLWSNFDKNTG